MRKSDKIYIAGHKGLVGSAIHRKLIDDGYTNIIVRTSKEVDLTDYDATLKFFQEEKPDYVFLAAAKVGGVMANEKFPAEFLIVNLRIQNNIIDAATKVGVKKLLFLGSNCIYPDLAARPLKEEYLMAGKLEPKTEAYALAKLAGIKMCQAYRRQYGCNYIIALPVNMYGENDRYDAENSHVMPALLMKFKTANETGVGSVRVWGSGNAKREFMYSDDLADACLFLMLNYNDHDPINIGTGEEISIKDLAFKIKNIIGYSGQIIFDNDKPEGSSGKMLDTSKMDNLGWKPKIKLDEGIKKVYDSL